MNDLQDFIKQNPDCLAKVTSVAPDFADALSKANFVDARSDPSIYQQTLGQLGGKSLSAEEQKATLGQVFSGGGAAATLWDTNTIYIGPQYYEEIVGWVPNSIQPVWGRSNSVTRGQTGFHEGLHLYFKTGHVGLLSSLQKLGIPDTTSKYTIPLSAETAAALNINAWLKSGCR